MISTVKRIRAVSEAPEEWVWEDWKSLGRDLNGVRGGGARISVGRLFLLRDPSAGPEVRAGRERTVGYKEREKVPGAGCFLRSCSFSHNHIQIRASFATQATD